MSDEALQRLRRLKRAQPLNEETHYAVGLAEAYFVLLEELRALKREESKRIAAAKSGACEVCEKRKSRQREIMRRKRLKEKKAKGK